MRPAARDVIVVAVAAAAGLAIGYVDSRPAWDDTGITVGALVLSSGILAIIRPRAWWAVALGVGLPVPVFNYLLHGDLVSFAALAFAFAAAALGMLVGRMTGWLADS